MQSKLQVKQTTIELIQGDITHQDTDAIVNAANSSLLGGGGVDGAIHNGAGPDLLRETQNLGGCRTGDAKITGGYRLKAKYVIHAVGPIYQRNNDSVPGLLASAYRRSLEVGVANNLTSIAFPSISTGAYGYPVNQAAEIALQTVIEFAQLNVQYALIRFVLFDHPTWQLFCEELSRIAGGGDYQSSDIV